MIEQYLFFARFPLRHVGVPNPRTIDDINRLSPCDSCKLAELFINSLGWISWVIEDHGDFSINFEPESYHPCGPGSGQDDCPNLEQEYELKTLCDDAWTRGVRRTGNNPANHISCLDGNC